MFLINTPSKGAGVQTLMKLAQNSIYTYIFETKTHPTPFYKNQDYQYQLQITHFDKRFGNILMVMYTFNL